MFKTYHINGWRIKHKIELYKIKNTLPSQRNMTTTGSEGGSVLVKFSV
jgi:hypothetical protein